LRERTREKTSERERPKKKTKLFFIHPHTTTRNITNKNLKNWSAEKEEEQRISLTEFCDSPQQPHFTTRALVPFPSLSLH